MSSQDSTSSDETVVGKDNHDDKDDHDDKTKRAPKHRHTRSGASRRQQQESTLNVAIQQLQLLTDPTALKSHEAILHQMLDLLEQDHIDYVNNNDLDINAGPEATYMDEIRAKVDRVIQKQRKRLPVDNQMVVDQSMGAVGGQDFRMVEDELADHMSSVSQRSRSSSL